MLLAGKLKSLEEEGERREEERLNEKVRTEHPREYRRKKQWKTKRGGGKGFGGDRGDRGVGGGEYYSEEKGDGSRERGGGSGRRSK
jgi:hypothetical protein